MQHIKKQSRSGSDIPKVQTPFQTVYPFYLITLLINQLLPQNTTAQRNISVTIKSLEEIQKKKQGEEELEKELENSTTEGQKKQLETAITTIKQLIKDKK